MDELEKLKNAKTIEQRTDYIIEELYKLVDNIDVLTIGVVKRLLLFNIAVLKGVFK